MSIDPRVGKFRSASPYAYVSNNPIFYKDPDGREQKTSIFGPNNLWWYPISIRIQANANEKTKDYMKDGIKPFDAMTLGYISELGERIGAASVVTAGGVIILKSGAFIVAITSEVISQIALLTSVSPEVILFAATKFPREFSLLVTALEASMPYDGTLNSSYMDRVTILVLKLMCKLQEDILEPGKKPELEPDDDWI